MRQDHRGVVVEAGGRGMVSGGGTEGGDSYQEEQGKDERRRPKD